MTVHEHSEQGRPGMRSAMHGQLVSTTATQRLSLLCVGFAFSRSSICEASRTRRRSYRRRRNRLGWKPAQEVALGAGREGKKKEIFLLVFAHFCTAPDGSVPRRLVEPPDGAATFVPICFRPILVSPSIDTGKHRASVSKMLELIFLFYDSPSTAFRISYLSCG